MQPVKNESACQLFQMAAILASTPVPHTLIFHALMMSCQNRVADWRALLQKKASEG
jgi:hypothetical protein